LETTVTNGNFSIPPTNEGTPDFKIMLKAYGDSVLQKNGTRKCGCGEIKKE